MGDLGAEPRLVVPEGMMIDESSRERLHRLLALAPASIAGVAAETGELPPGASYRVHAEWLSLEPSSIASETADATSVSGAALLRPGVEFTVHDGVVEIADGALAVDRGAHAHDPYRPIGTLVSASERGRPPFPRRPVVLFLGCDAEGHADWVRRLVNRLVRRDVEARIALPDVAPGMHLTLPCLGDAATLHALAPDVVVTLDAAAAERAEAWCAGDRSTVFVGFDPNLSDGPELVSWQIDRAAGRLRARIGPRVDVQALVALVGRLCAGPHPMPPPDLREAAPTRVAVREHWASRPSGGELGFAVVTGALDAPAAARVDGLLDHLAAASVLVGRAPVGSALSSDARRAGVVLLAGIHSGPGVAELVADRRRAGLPVVLDLGPRDVEPESVASDAGAARLTDTAAALAQSCGLVVSPPGAIHDAARAAGLRALAVPTLLTRKRAAELQEARARFDPTAPRVIGWHIGEAGAPVAAYQEVVARMVTKFLTAHPEVRLDLVGDPARAPIAKRAHPHVAIIPEDRLDAKTLARWTVHVWTPALIAGEVAEDARVFEAASCAGVPTVMPLAARRVVDGFVKPGVIAGDETDAEEWERVLRHVLVGVERRAHRAIDTMRRANAVDGLATSRSVATRLVGWAAYRPDQSQTGQSRAEALPVGA